MSNAITPIRPSDPAKPTAGGVVRAAAPPPARSLFDIAMASPRIEAGSAGALRRSFWLPFPPANFRAASATSIAQADFAPLHEVLAPERLREAAQEALLESADRTDQSPSRFAATSDFAAPRNAPSRNSASAQSDLRRTLVARDEAGDAVTLDLHVARLSESHWEAAAFDRADASRDGAFPYAALPLGVAALHFDANAGGFVLPQTGRMLQLIPSVPKRPRRLPWISGIVGIVGLGVGALALVRILA